MTELQPSPGDVNPNANDEVGPTADVKVPNQKQDLEQARPQSEGSGDAVKDTKNGGGEDEDNEDEDESDEEDEDDEDEDEEPKLKYVCLTKHMGAVYRNGDATSAFLVAGDKMIVGTHNGNIVSSYHGSSVSNRQLMLQDSNSMSFSSPTSNPYLSTKPIPPPSPAFRYLRIRLRPYLKLSNPKLSTG